MSSNPANKDERNASPKANGCSSGRGVRSNPQISEITSSPAHRDEQDNTPVANGCSLRQGTRRNPPNSGTTSTTPAHDSRLWPSIDGSDKNEVGTSEQAHASTESKRKRTTPLRGSHEQRGTVISDGDDEEPSELVQASAAFKRMCASSDGSGTEVSATKATTLSRASIPRSSISVTGAVRSPLSTHQQEDPIPATRAHDSMPSVQCYEIKVKVRANFEGSLKMLPKNPSEQPREWIFGSAGQNHGLTWRIEALRKEGHPYARRRPEWACFLDMPVELQNIIYLLLFADTEPFDLGDPRNFQHSAAMLRTHSRIYHEGKEVLYADNAFVFQR